MTRLITFSLLFVVPLAPAAVAQQASTEAEIKQLVPYSRMLRENPTLSYDDCLPAVRALAKQIDREQGRQTLTTPIQPYSAPTGPVHYNGPVPLYGSHPDLTDGPAVAPSLAESVLTRQILGLVRALGVVVAGGRLVPAPMLPAPRVEVSPRSDDPVRRWFVGGVLALLGAVTLVSMSDFLARRRALERWQKRCAVVGYQRCVPYTIYEQRRGVPPPTTLPRRAG
jgi:hypothetical protein